MKPQKPKIGINDLASTSPNIAKEWHPELNALNPDEVKSGSGYKAIWLCQNGHTYEMPINERQKGRGCKYCSNKAIWGGFNDLSTISPLLASEWHHKANTKSPAEVTSGSSYSAWWRCRTCSHEWSQTVHNRSKGHGCPLCSGNEVVIGINDLMTTHPLISLEWSKNNIKTVYELSAGSDYKANWHCKICNYEWKAKVYNRTRGNSCPNCNKVPTSKIEERFRDAFSEIIEGINSDHTYSVRFLSSNKRGYVLYQVDIIGTFEGQNIIIEYDGSYWHKDKANKDIEKTKAFLDRNYIVIRIREKGLNLLPIEHNNFYQINYWYEKISDYYEHIPSTISSVSEWLIKNKTKEK